MRYKYSSATVPPEVLAELEYLIALNDLEYADNYRFTPDDDSEGVLEFEEIRDGGCCGSFEGGATDKTGRRWWVGCNYGH